MTRSLGRVLASTTASITVIATASIFTTVVASAEQNSEGKGDSGGLAGINHLVVIYEENRSFDNLYGSFPGANGISRASATSTTQVTLTGTPYTTLPQTDSHIPTNLPNQPFDITKYVPADQKTRDLVHRYYQEQVQIDGGKMDKFVAVSDAAGLSVGFYPTAKLPVAKEAANFVLADNFFHAAFGGSFLNHQWLVCACTPAFANADRTGGAHDLHTVLDSNGLPVKDHDGQLTTAAAGDFAVNTIFPASTPTIKSAPQLPLLTNKTIGDELSEENVSWAWYSGGWNAANSPAGPPNLFQFHHQPFNYYANYAPGTPGREHLKDETDFIAAAKAGTLPAVSFVKPLGPDNEHPGYTDLLTGEQHLMTLIDDVRNGPNWKDTAIVITYDEHGGFWDHVAPPTSKKHSDVWGPGSRVPTIIISPLAKRHFVDHTLYDTTSILATIEHRWDLEPLGTRDAKAHDLRRAFTRRENEND